MMTKTDQQEILEEVARDFDRRLASLKARDTRAKIEAVMAFRGKANPRPIAGPAF